MEHGGEGYRGHLEWRRPSRGTAGRTNQKAAMEDPGKKKFVGRGSRKYNDFQAGGAWLEEDCKQGGVGWHQGREGVRANSVLMEDMRTPGD